MGRDPRQRRHLGRFLLGACVYAFSLVLQWYVSTWDNFVRLHGVKPYAVGVSVTMQDTIARADMLLYRAKDAGRDRVLQAA